MSPVAAPDGAAADPGGFAWLDDSDLARPAAPTRRVTPTLESPVEPASAPAATAAPPPEIPVAPPSFSGMDGDSAASLRAQIRELKEKLHTLQSAAPPPLLSAERPAQDTTSKSVLGSRYHARHYGHIEHGRRTAQVDEFGLDPAYEARLRGVLDFLHGWYFRVEADGIANVPDTGRCLIVTNHSGGPVPLDGLMLRATLRRQHPARRDLRWLSEDFIHHLPFVGAIMSRLGAVRACQQNAERLLAKGHAVAVFPEGAKGIGRLFRERYRLQRFGRGGFIRLCLRTSTPLVPCALVGPEEASPTLFRLEHIARYFAIPHLPITPTFPLLGPVGLLPAPTKWKLCFGEPVSFDGYDADGSEDEVLVGRLSDKVRATIQGMLDAMVARRRSVFFG